MLHSFNVSIQKWRHWKIQSQRQTIKMNVCITGHSLSQKFRQNILKFKFTISNHFK